MGAYLCIASNDVPPAVSKRVSLSVQCKCCSCPPAHSFITLLPLSLSHSHSSCAHGARTQPAAGHAARLRCAAGVPGRSLALARLLLAEGRTHLQWLLQHFHGQPGDGLTRSRDAARWVSKTKSKANQHFPPSNSLYLSLSPSPVSVPNTASRRNAMAIAASCCLWCVHFRPPMWAPITASAQTRWDVPRARCGYTVRMRNPQFSWARAPCSRCLFICFFFFSSAEIKLHPGASSSNDEHSNFIGGKRRLRPPLPCQSPIHALPSLSAGLEEAARNAAASRLAGTVLPMLGVLPQLLLLLRWTA